MDFLDPRRRKAHKRRLFIGYVLMSIVVAIGTLIILYLAYGYDIDRENGGVIQNGIVFVESKPNGAAVFVNDVRQRESTGTRLVLPAGVYTIRLEAEGYRHWERTFNLDGGEIQRLVYPYLIPNNLVINDIKAYDARPQLATQSPDRRWVLVQVPGQTYLFDLFDLANPDEPPTQVLIPMAILTNPASAATLKVVEWSTDNRHLVVERSFDQTTEYLMLDREDPALSININATLGIKPAKLSLRDKHPEKLYFLDVVPGTLRSADLRARTISAPLAQGVIDYRSYGEDIVMYVTHHNVTDTGRVEFRVLEGSREFTLKSVGQSDNYVLDVSRYEDKWYYVVGAAADNLAFVYQNPLDSLKANETSLNVSALLRLDNPQFASFSANTQFIAVQSGNNLLTFDLEDRRQYRTILDHDIPLNQELDWMDGHRLLYTVSGQSYMIEFDGSNEETLVTSELMPGPFFDRDYDNIFTIETSKADPGKKALTITEIDD